MGGYKYFFSTVNRSQNMVKKAAHFCGYGTAGAADQGCHLAFCETVFQKFNGLASYWPFWKLKKIVPFKVCLRKIWAKITIIYELLNNDLVILHKFHKKIDLFKFFWTWQPFCRCRCKGRMLSRDGSLQQRTQIQNRTKMIQYWKFHSSF